VTGGQGGGSFADNNGGGVRAAFGKHGWAITEIDALGQYGKRVKGARGLQRSTTTIMDSDPLGNTATGSCGGGSSIFWRRAY